MPNQKKKKKEENISPDFLIVIGIIVVNITGKVY